MRCLSKRRQGKIRAFEVNHADEVVDVTKPFGSAFDFLDSGVDALGQTGGQSAVKETKNSGVMGLNRFSKLFDRFQP